MRVAGAVAALLLACPAYADMYQDMSNAVGGKRAGTFYAQAFGSCTWDASHDVGACVNAALNTAADNGGGAVVVPAGTYGLSTKIVWPATGGPVGLHCPAGMGAGVSTRLKWIGAIAGRMAEVRTLTGQIDGAELKNCAFDGNLGLAADGLYIASSYHGHFDDLTFTGGFSGGNVVTVTADAATGAGSQQNTLDNLYIDNGTNWGGTFPYTSNQLKLGAFMDAAGVHGNAAFNFARNIFIGGSAGTGFLCEGCDNNHISGRIFNSGTSVDMTVAVSGAHMFPANGNQLTPFGYNGSYIARGQTTFPSCAPYSTCTYNNFVDIDQTNGTPAPTQEPGADLHWGSNSGYRSGLSLIGLGTRQPALLAAAGYSIWGACTQNAAGQTNVLYLCDSDNTPYVTFDGIGGSKFSIDNTAGGAGQNLRFNRIAGTGIFEFDKAPVRMATATVATLPACAVATKNAVMAVSDQNGAPTYRGALTGGGAIAVLAFCNGASWEAH